MNQETEQEKKYREDFKEEVCKRWDIKTVDDSIFEDMGAYFEYYLASCKKRQEEIEGWKRVAYLKSNTCDSLKEELDRYKKALEVAISALNWQCKNKECDCPIGLAQEQINQILGKEEEEK